MIPREEELIYRSRWLVRIRWLVPLVMGAGIFGSYLLSLPYALLPLSELAAGVIFYNLIFVAAEKWAFSSPVNLKRVYRFVNMQIATDFLVLLVWIHFTGGPISPFMPFFIFHLILCGILVSKRSTLIHATWVLVGLVLITLGEKYNLLPHYSPIIAKVSRPIDYTPHLIVISIVTFTTLITTAVLVGGIAKRLRKHELELDHARKSLEQHSVEMEEAHKQLEKLFNERTSFFRMVSHQLRSPLASIQSVLRLVTTRRVEDMEKITDLVSRADMQAQHLLELVNDLLSLTRLKSMQDLDKKEYVAMGPLLADLIERSQISAHEKEITLVSKIDSNLPSIPAVRNKTEQLFVVLLENAIKYTPQKGRVTIQASTKNMFLYVLVSDTGIGVPEDAQEKIFGEFYRASNAKKFTRVGTGLGLSLAQTIVKDLKGSIEIESIPGKGSTFTVIIPFEPQSS